MWFRIVRVEAGWHNQILQRAAAPFYSLPVIDTRGVKSGVIELIRRFRATSA